MSQADLSNLAYSIGELADKGPIRRSSIYNQIAAGRLRARKIGRRTVVLDEDWRAFLASAPVIAPIKTGSAVGNITAPSHRSRGRPPKVPDDAMMEPVEASTVATTTTAKTPAPSTQAKTEAGS
jgi:hypothetical protein